MIKKLKNIILKYDELSSDMSKPDAMQNIKLFTKLAREHNGMTELVDNAKILSQTLLEDGFDIVSGGTDSHLVLLDLRPKGIKGNEAEDVLGKANITCNKNGVPFDPEKPTITSGIRLGTPAGTTRGFGQAEFRKIGAYICEVLNGFQLDGVDTKAILEVQKKVIDLCRKFPIYGGNL